MSVVRIFRVPFYRTKFIVMLSALACVAGASAADEAFAVGRMMSRQEARHLGLERAWFAQVELDRARHRVERAILTGDRLTVLTSAGVVQEFDARTGQTLWISPVGTAKYPSLGPAASDKYVAVVNGSTLYVLRRADGKPVLHRRVSGGPGAAPAVAEEYVFVPLISGRMEGYPLNQGEETRTPWYYTSYGRAMVAPFATSDVLVWSTDKGRVYVGSSLPPAVRFRLETPSDIVASPAHRTPLVYVATMNGELFAMHEQTGERLWKFATGYPIVRAPAAVGDRVYVTSDEPALHAVDAKTGNALWSAPNIKKFAAASRQRVYGIDDLDALVVLDAKTGAMLDRKPTDGTADALVNDQTDRLYLISDRGLVQCLHEIGSKEPLIHNPPQAEEPKPKPSTEPTGVPTTTEAPPAESEETAEPPAGGEVNPFGALEEGEPAEAADEPTQPDDGFGVDEDNPFESDE